MGLPRASPLGVAVAVLLFQVAWVGLLFARGFEVRDFIGLGRAYVVRGDQSGPIHIDPAYHYTANGIGYDGQWAYYIAVDPGRARAHLDGPSYRLGRILYPALARLLALGRASLVPYALLALNLGAVFAGCLAIGAWLRRRDRSAWWAAVFGLFPGITIAVHRDLTEVVAYSLAALAVLALDSRSRRRWVLGGLLFAAAVLARETTAVFAVVYALAEFKRRPAVSVGILALALFPLAAWDLYLVVRVGPIDTGQASRFTPIPLGGMLAARPWRIGHARVVLSMILPGLLCFAAAAVGWWRGARGPAVVCLAANVGLFVLFLPPQSYIDSDAAMRVSTGVVLAALLSIPVLSEALRSDRWIRVCAALWLVTIPVTLAANALDHPAGLIRV